MNYMAIRWPIDGSFIYNGFHPPHIIKTNLLGSFIIYGEGYVSLGEMP